MERPVEIPMKDLRKTPMANIDLSIEDIRIVGFAEFTPRETSFFVAWGCSFLETMNRIRNFEEMTNPIWEKINRYLELAQKVAERRNVEKALKALKNLVAIIKETDPDTCSDWLRLYFEENQRNALQYLDTGIKCLICAICDKTFIEYDIFERNSLQNKKIMINSFLKAIDICCIIAKPHKVKRFTDIRADQAPILWFFMREKNDLCEGYLQEHIDFDKSAFKNELDTNRFPFIFFKENRMRARSVVASTSTSPPDLKDEIISNLLNKIMGSSKDLNLERMFRQLIEENPYMNQGDVKTLYDSLTLNS